MTHAYTPGLRVTRRCVIRKTRRLPLRGEVLASVKDEVNAEDVVARTDLPGNVKAVKAANLLRIPPSELRGCMLKQEQEAVREGEIIARSKSLFGLFQSVVKANTTGVIETISEVTGQVTLREPAFPVRMNAYVNGVVTEVMPEEGVVVETAGAFIQGIFGIGGEEIGTLRVLVKDPAAVADPESLGEETGRVLVVGSLATRRMVTEARAHGAVAVVAAGIADEDLCELLGYDLGVAITGTEDLGITVIATEGFGRLTMGHKTFDLLSSLDGRKASVNGATQIRAGVLRPEIIVPEPNPGGTQEAIKAHGEGLEVGMTVRAIREPYFGRLGRVTELPPELYSLPTEARVRVLRVEFAGGEKAVLPRANVEMIED